MKSRVIVSLLAAAAALSSVTACENPAEGKPTAAVGSAAAPAPADLVSGRTERLTLAPETSKIEFVGAKVTRSHPGRFHQFSGTAELKGGKAEGSQVTVDIQLGSVETDAERLTGHLKSDDFFDVNKHPVARFRSTRIEKGGQGGSSHTITGNLDLHGVTKSVSFPAKVEVAGDAVRVKSEFSINRKDWNIVYPGAPDDLIRDEVLIKLDLHLPRGQK